MLRAGVFDDFKGATTLLLWGDSEGMAALCSSLGAIGAGKSIEFAIDGPAGGLIITLGEGSMLANDSEVLLWQCSRETLDLAADLTEALVHQAGHHFLDVDGLAEQVIFARDEYPPDLR